MLKIGQISKHVAYAGLCRISYESKNKVKTSISNELPEYKLIAHYWTKSNSDKIYLFSEKGKSHVIVSIRGTDSISDLKSNISYWRLVAKKTARKLKNILKKYNEITFIGHSRGGAIALLLKDILSKNFSSKTTKAITFASPGFIRSRNVKTSNEINYVNQGDIIPIVFSRKIISTHLILEGGRVSKFKLAKFFNIFGVFMPMNISKDYSVAYLLKKFYKFYSSHTIKAYEERLKTFARYTR